MSKTSTYGYLENSSLPESLSMPNNMMLSRAYEEKRELVASMTYKRDRPPHHPEYGPKSNHPQQCLHRQ